MSDDRLRAATERVDPKRIREQLLPQSGWRPWQTPNPALDIDEWVKKQGVKRGDLPAHFDQDGCPYWYVRRGLVTAVAMADQQAKHWREDHEQIVNPAKLRTRPATKPDYIAVTLDRYVAEAAAVTEGIEVLQKLISRFWQTHLGIDGNLFRYDQHKAVAGAPVKPDIDVGEVLAALQCLGPKLQTVMKNATIARKPWINNKGDIWKQTFVAHMGLVWLDLTGRRPTHAKPFEDFIGDAWASLGSPDTENFENAIRLVAPGFARHEDGPRG
jgi:hypothetical protein